MIARSGLVLQNVEIQIGQHRLLRLDLQVAPGETLSVMGPSGAGKSTLFAFVAGFLDPAFAASGRVLLNGREISKLPPEKRQVGLLFQDPMLYPHMSVGGNLLFALPRAVRARSARRAAAQRILEDVELRGYFDRDPATLSGGQQARVALARTLLSMPEALLLDEPFSRLDANLRQTIRSLVFSLIAARKIPALLVTHDPADAAAAGGPVVEIGS